MTLPRRLAARLAREDGFTMLFALLALFVGALLAAAAFTAANGDIKLTHRATVQEKAYYAAVAGVNRYQYQLTSSPEYWTKCPSLGTEAVPLKVTGTSEEFGTSDEYYAVKTLGSTGHTCESGKQATILETGTAAKGTFRILSTGTVKEGNTTVTRKIVATFSHPGFTKYVYESNYEVEDPVNFGREASTCEFYYSYRSTHNLTELCPVIQFAPTDEVNGPMHTNDASAVCAKNGNAPKFGREGHNDEIAMNGGHYAAGGCTDAPNIVGEYKTNAGSILPPETDAELLEAAGTKFAGRTEIELRSGSPNTMVVKTKGEPAKTMSFPSNGVVYVENSKSEACAITNYTPFGSNTVDDTGCGNVYVHGTYTESLTIASADDVIVNGNLTTTSESSGEPTGGATLGLIAENFVRVYHPVKTNYETKNVVPPTQAPLEGKCVTLKELSAKVLKSTEVTEVATTGLSTGDEVVGTVAGEIEAGTTISEIKAGEKLRLSKAAKPPPKELTAKITNNSTELKEVNTTGLVTGAEVEGTVAGQIETGTTISSINAAAKTVTLSKAAQTSSTAAGGVIVKTTLVKEINTTGLANGEEVEGTGIEAGTIISSFNAAAKTVTLSKAAKPTLKSIGGKINKSTEVKEINTAGLVNGAEVEGTGIPAGTTITSFNAGAKTVTLSNAAKPATTKSVSGKITSGKTEVTGITTTGLEVGQTVEGPVAEQIAAGTTITAINAGAKTITLSQAAKKTETVTLKFSGETTTLKFYGEAVTLTFSPVSENTKVKVYGEVTKLKIYHATGYEYNPVFEGGKCHKVETGYDEYRESENRYIEACEGNSTNYEGEGLCKIVFGTGSCPSKATELNAAEDPNGWGMMKDPVIDAAILSTNHSWIVDNYKCGNLLGTLTVWGSIAQFWRGPVGTSGGSGYIKNYNYDDRLANQQPPSFLAPTNATSWKVSRETAAPASFTG